VSDHRLRSNDSSVLIEPRQVVVELIAADMSPEASVRRRSFDADSLKSTQTSRIGLKRAQRGDHGFRVLVSQSRRLPELSNLRGIVTVPSSWTAAMATSPRTPKCRRLKDNKNPEFWAAAVVLSSPRGRNCIDEEVLPT
jgi:hypothetical protein